VITPGKNVDGVCEVVACVYNDTPPPSKTTRNLNKIFLAYENDG
jgi:hypothetical protein